MASGSASWSVSGRSKFSLSGRTFTSGAAKTGWIRCTPYWATNFGRSGYWHGSKNKEYGRKATSLSASAAHRCSLVTSARCSSSSLSWQGCHLPPILTCSATVRGTSSLTTVSIQEPFSTILDTKTFSTRPATPSWRQIGSRVCGKNDPR